MVLPGIENPPDSRARAPARKGGVVEAPHYGSRFSWSIVRLLEWIPKQVTGRAHASAARVLHCARVLNTAVVCFAFVALVVGIGLACVGGCVPCR